MLGGAVGIEVLIVGAMVASVGALVARSVKREQRAQQLLRQIKADDRPRFVCYSRGPRFQAGAVGGVRSKWEPYVITVDAEQIALYPLVKPHERCVSFAPAQIRWLGRPRKYHYGENELWVHVEQDDRWWWIKLKLYQNDMQSLIRTLKEVITPELVTAYRRRRPYVHLGPVSAQPAVQDMHGAWTLDAPISLFLTPAALVLLNGMAVQRIIPIEQVQQVSAFRRLDQPRAAGLVRFKAGEETLAFALDSFEGLAAALAEAAKRTLEDPLIRKKKAEDYES